MNFQASTSVHVIAGDSGSTVAATSILLSSDANANASVGGVLSKDRKPRRTSKYLQVYSCTDTRLLN
jgi:hypothetical protein